jgi:hypothetical protein
VKFPRQLEEVISFPKELSLQLRIIITLRKRDCPTAIQIGESLGVVYHVISEIRGAANVTADQPRVAGS